MITDVSQLPPPECESGYPWTQIEEFMDEQQVHRLEMWMEGQTMMLCQGKRFDHDSGLFYESCGGVAHGGVVYPHDLHRFIEAGPIID